jgi:hypothetical protein
LRLPRRDFVSPENLISGLEQKRLTVASEVVDCARLEEHAIGIDEEYPLRSRVMVGAELCDLLVDVSVSLLGSQVKPISHHCDVGRELAAIRGRNHQSNLIEAVFCGPLIDPELRLIRHGLIQ